ncbi:efflux RND transporter periplasmic adaptor subunit [Ectothiorhodospira lacustris]|uniref:efflux RND transporter periplasmic adaptor subunit n=1 Tax=Ectothiorhodospira lacustris TaxID=2899127 RepID=UPI001EE9160D|nr:efflux RND transporter periplasmic adaptor subunit [Ectothiorhodospira lacustris]MCG5501497.1 efflux RND transporter periplasmic adaptor subunit [Ectothiorhodospira lacustris]MCG5509670.1 efflux RND transporter periplasmic adaptor subunit [Ectothiorhodospira lacustris]MCG5523097.1 efflux RND transporter periplasmic adaptor subunit [Ectothiorhodospira lacustris]
MPPLAPNRPWFPFVSSLLAVCLLSACGGPPEPEPEPRARPVMAVALESPTGLAARSFSARAEAAERTGLAFRVSGQVVSVRADLGDYVLAGTELARLDDRDYRLKVRELEGQLAAAEGQLAEARANFERGRTLVADGTISRADFDRLQAGFRQARGQRDALTEGLATARAALEDTVLRSPFNAHVAVRAIEPFEQVSPQRVVFVLDRLDVIELRVGMPETLVVHRERLTSVDVHFAALDRDYPGRLKAIGVDVDEDTQTYPVRIAVANPDRQILPGMTARVDFRAGLPEGRIADHFLVPLTAVLEHQGEHHVWRLDEADERVHRVPVSLGPLEREGMRIKGDLQVGQRVVVAGVQHLEEGQWVRLLTEDDIRGARR